MSDYKEITTNEAWMAAAQANENVSFVASLSHKFMNHMMAGGFDENMQPLAHLYIEPAASIGIYEILGYYSKSKGINADDLQGAKFRIYGTLRQVSGPGFGGNKHSETYVIIDKLELL